VRDDSGQCTASQLDQPKKQSTAGDLSHNLPSEATPEGTVGESARADTKAGRRKELSRSLSSLRHSVARLLR
jgi:hypothetical protein